MNRRSFVGAATGATACALGRPSLMTTAWVHLTRVRSSLGLDGPIVLRGFFRLGYCPLYLHEEESPGHREITWTELFLKEKGFVPGDDAGWHEIYKEYGFLPPPEFSGLRRKLKGKKKAGEISSLDEMVPEEDPGHGFAGYANPTGAAKAYDVLRAMGLGSFSDDFDARDCLGLVLSDSGFRKDVGRYPLITGRDNARLFRERLGEVCEDVRLELPDVA